jgi:hypothetical protein
MHIVFSMRHGVFKINRTLLLPFAKKSISVELLSITLFSQKATLDGFNLLQIADIVTEMSCHNFAIFLGLLLPLSISGVICYCWKNILLAKSSFN